MTTAAETAIALIVSIRRAGGRIYAEARPDGETSPMLMVEHPTAWLGKTKFSDALLTRIPRVRQALLDSLAIGDDLENISARIAHSEIRLARARSARLAR